MKCYWLVEGHGDVKAAPELWRNWRNWKQCYLEPLEVKTYRIGNFCEASDFSELTKATRYALQRLDTHSCIILMDADQHCPREISATISSRLGSELTHLVSQKKLAVCLAKSEFETWFLYSLQNIASRTRRYHMDLSEYDAGRDWESVRNAKGSLSGYFSNRAYHETEDQSSLANHLDFDQLIQRSRSFQHLNRVLEWIHNDSIQSGVYQIT